MGLPTQPVTLTAAQIEDLNRKLAAMRHDVNNHLSLMMAAAELIRYKPEVVGKMMDSLSQQPAKIGEVLARFSQEFEKSFGITRP